MRAGAGRGRRHLRVGVAAVCAVIVSAVPSNAAPAPQVVDPQNDANGGGYWATNPDTPTPAGSQPYADVTSILFATTRATRRIGGRPQTTITGFTVTMQLTGPPDPPLGAVGVYRVLATGAGCLFGIDYYTSRPGTQPQAGVQEWCGPSIRRVALAPPVVRGATITWSVPLAAVPRNARVGIGTTLTDLHFEVLVRTNDSACAGAAGTPGEEREPCAIFLDGTFDRSGTYTIR